MFWRTKNQQRLDEAVRAREAAEANLALTKAQTEAFAELGQSLRALRSRNHFGDAIASAFRAEDPDDATARTAEGE